jgi:hypothetical protein
MAVSATPSENLNVLRSNSGRPFAVSDGMADADSPRPPRPPLIPGIYNFCDTRCPRCPFNTRCLLYVQQQRTGSADPIGDVRREYPAPDPPPEFLELVSRANEDVRNMTPEESEAIEQEYEARRAQISADRLVIAARYYTMTAWRITEALAPIVEERGDPAVIEAVETIGALSGLVSSKTYRALSSEADEDFDRFDLESDANGSAKVARLIIADSRRAWQILTDIGRAAADGVPVALIRVLDEIDTGLARRFPRAMSFVRPGFDTEGVVS